MMRNIIFTSPLEQFEIRPIFTLNLGFFDLVITNAMVMVLVAVAGLAILLYAISCLFSRVKLICTSKDEITIRNVCFYIVPNRWQGVIESMQKFILKMVGENIKNKDAQYYFPLIFFLFFYMLMLNLIGLIPYSFTLTSQIIVTLSISVAVFIGINIVSIRKHGIHTFALFLPPGTSIVLALLLVPIELISYIFKPISLSIRLFANMMAGHTLLKVIAGFAYTLMGCSGIYFILHYVPVFILVVILVLELAVAAIQAFVFSLLICIYINDALNLH
jgi:ATP synthase subunit 6